MGVRGADSRQFRRGPHPDSASGRPGERWKEARTEHETDRKQIGPEPAAINHHRGARPSHSSHMHATHTRTNARAHAHTHKYAQQEMKCGNSSEKPCCNTPGNRWEKNHSLLTPFFNSVFFPFSLSVLSVGFLQHCIPGLTLDKRSHRTINTCASTETRSAC